MYTPDFYCEECGAANLRTAVRCYACNSLLEASPKEEPSSPVLSGSFQVQLDLSEGSMTVIPLVSSVRATPLLHERYEVLGQVGAGGFGSVYRARDTLRSNRMVAVKTIKLNILSASQSIEATDTFNREFSLLSSLEHAHLPHIHEYFSETDHWYLVMDFVDGETLDEYVLQLEEKFLPVEEVIDIGLQLCEVLSYLHHLQPPIIFRDLKPANIMRTPGGHLYLIDFGIARRFKRGQVKDTVPLGSPGFAAPEQYGKSQTTPRSDIYSLGATLYFLLSGSDPADNPFHLEPISTLCPALPESLAACITSMLALDPAERPANIAAVQLTLNSALPRSRPRMPADIVLRRPRRLSDFLKGLFAILA